MRVLLIKDDKAASKGIEPILCAEGFTIDTAGFGEEGEALNRSMDYDIILLDLNLSEKSGYAVLHSLRSSRIPIPLLILTSLAGISNELHDLGIDDENCMMKPFHKNELIARIHDIIQRSSGNFQSIVQVGNLLVDLGTQTVSVKGMPIYLSSKEYQVLELLLLRKGKTLTKAMFLDHLYGGIREPEHKIIDVFICNLRKKLSAASGGECFIETVWGRGYVIHDTDENTIKAA